MYRFIHTLEIVAKLQSTSVNSTKNYAKIFSQIRRSSESKAAFHIGSQLLVDPRGRS